MGAFRTVLWYYCGMDLSQVPTETLQARHREMLQVMYAIRCGEAPAGMTRGAAIAERDRVEVELHGRGEATRPDVRKSTAASARLSQKVVASLDFTDVTNELNNERQRANDLQARLDQLEGRA